MLDTVLNALVNRMREFVMADLRRDLDHVRMAIGRQESRAVRAAAYGSLRESEFKVFSQWGEDGIIQYLLGKVPIENTTFVEFGVESYEEANTRFLLQNDNWRGLIIDGGTRHKRFVRAAGLEWRHDVTALSAFVTRENINDLLRGARVAGDIGLLSVDIDGNDYWVFEAINVVHPRIVVLEYNSTFGPTHAVTVPYDPTFVRGKAHPSNLYYGASLSALCILASRKGYVFTGSNSAGNNAFFVREDLANGVPRPSPKEGWIASRFREATGALGERVSSHRDRLELIAHLPVISVTDDRRISIGEIFGIGGGPR